MHSNNQDSYKFNEFRLDVGERLLVRDNLPVPLTPKVFDVLAVLVERSGHLVEKDEVLRIVWEDSFVEESTVARAVHTLRKVLGEDAEYKFIETVAKKGYRFVAEVEKISEVAKDSENGHQFPLTTAEKLTEIDAQTLPSTNKTAVQLVSKPKHTTRIILIAVSILSVISLICLLAFNRQSASVANSNTSKSIAVLPIKPINVENHDFIYELGIADSLINKLSPVKGLTVRPLSATRKYSDIEQDAIVAGKEQQVDYVLASNYQITDGKIRVTSQLINVQTGVIEETLRSDKDNADKLLMEDAIANDFGNTLLKQLGKTENTQTAKRGTDNEEAYRLYLEGMFLADKRNQKDARQAIEFFEQAVKLDTNFALAYVGLAYAHRSFSALGGGNPHEEYVISKNAIEKALQLDESLSEAHTTLGEIQMSYEWDFPAAEKSLHRAIELNPNSAYAHRFYALQLMSLERFDEAIAEAKTAVNLDPNSIFNQRILGMILYFARRYDEAIIQLKHVVEMDANHIASYYWLSASYVQKGDYTQAFEWFLRAKTQIGRSTEELNAWKTAYAKFGWQGVLRRQLEQAKQKEQTDKDYDLLSNVSAQLGDREQAFIYLEKGYRLRELFMVFVRIEPRLDSLRDDPRFDELVRRVGLN